MRKGFALFFVLIGVFIIAMLATTGYVYFRYFSQTPFPKPEGSSQLSQPTHNESERFLRLSKKPLNEPNYLAYLKKEVVEHNEKGFTKNRYTLVVVKEDGSEKKALFSYVRGGIDANQSAESLGYVYGKDNIMLQRIKGDNEDVKFFNKNGEDPLVLSFYEKHKDKGGIGLESYEFAASDHPTVSVENKSIAYIKSPVSEQQKSIAVFNLATNNEKIYKIDGDYRETGFILHFSPDNKKLYVCACVGFYWRGPSLGTWEIDLEGGQIIPLIFINELGIKNGIFRYDPNSVYGAKYEIFEREQVEGIPQRSKNLHKVDLDNQKITTINFNNYFEEVNVSKTGKFAHTLYYGKEYEKEFFIKNFNTGEEFRLEASKVDSWSDNDKLAFLIGDPEKTDTVELYIYNTEDKTKKLVDTIQVEKGSFCCKSTIEIIGWIH